MKNKIIQANWTLLDSIQVPKEKVDISKLTRDEQADLIIEKLSKPYVPPEVFLEEHMAEIMAAEIQKEIDAEILKTFAIPNKNLNNTTLTRSQIKTIINQHFGSIR